MPLTITRNGKSYTVSDDLAIKLGQAGKLTQDEMAQVRRGPGMYPADPASRTAPVDPLAGAIAPRPGILDAVNRGLAAITPSEAVPMSEAGPTGPPQPQSPLQITPGLARFGTELAGGGLAGLAANALVPELGIPATIARAAAVGLGTGAGSLAAETVDPTAAPLSNAIDAGTLAAGGETAARAIGRARRGASGLNVNPEALAVSKRAEALGGPGLTAGQLTDSAFVDTIESIAESSWFGGPVIRASKAANVDVAQGQLANLADQLGNKGPQYLGKALEDAAGRGRKSWLAVSDVLYDKVDSLAPNAQADLIHSGVATLADQLAAKNRELAPSVAKLQGEIDRLIDKYQGRSVPMFEARALRSNLLGISRGAEGDIKATALEDAASQMARLLDKEIERGYNLANPTGAAKKALDEAHAFFRGGAERFDKDLIAAIANKDPEALYRYAVQNGKPTQIKQIREAVTMRDTVNRGRVLSTKGSETWEQVQGHLLNDVLLSGTSEANIVGKSAGDFIRAGGEIKVGNASARLNAIGEEALGEIFTPSQLKAVRGNLEIISRATAPGAKKSPGLVAIALKQAGAATETIGFFFGGLALRGGQFPVAGSVMLFAPRALAKFVTNPATRNWLTIGMRAKPGTDLAIRASARLTTLALASGAEPMPTQPQGPPSATNPQPFFQSQTLGGPRGREAIR